MFKTGCCGSGSNAETNDGYEVVRIEKAKGNCALCEGYAERHQSKPVAVMSCDGACLRGEISRQAANILCHSLAPEKTVRICLGGAFTKDTGQRGLVRDSPRLIALEGCPVNCASRMMAGVIDGLTPEIVQSYKLCDIDKKLFGIDEMPPEEIQALARTVAEKIAATL
ncbi:DGC domain protein [Geobacter sp. OR-1]|uniref:putative zinc-binding protein n=1 Tax=Geobacter sp. OR-1 TaxID=1266765 RepID=UPI000543A207|nr:putative zinc-binding protein [Geobacter sp. OR-1]GAM09898.1 DGC domain protein [Geobacter sp. OR-1]